MNHRYIGVRSNDIPLYYEFEDTLLRKSVTVCVTGRTLYCSTKAKEPISNTMCKEFTILCYRMFTHVQIPNVKVHCPNGTQIFVFHLGPGFK